MWSTRKLDLQNKNSATLCHAFGCRKHTRLAWEYQGWFCPRHLREMRKIRRELIQLKISPPSDEARPREIALRQAEMNLRKRMEAGHCRYLLQLEDRRSKKNDSINLSV